MNSDAKQTVVVVHGTFAATGARQPAWYKRGSDFCTRLDAAEGWTCRVVAHSHGGNVALNALEVFSDGPAAWFNGKAALLGTPVINERGGMALSPRTLARRTWLSAGIAIALVLLATDGYRHQLWEVRTIGLIVGAAMLVLLALLAFTAWLVTWQANRPYQPKAVATRILLSIAEATRR